MIVFFYFILVSIDCQTHVAFYLTHVVSCYAPSVHSTNGVRQLWAPGADVIDVWQGDVLAGQVPVCAIDNVYLSVCLYVCRCACAYST